MQYSKEGIQKIKGMQKKKKKKKQKKKKKKRCVLFVVEYITPHFDRN